MLFTIILEFDGTNSVSQVSASNVQEAYKKWLADLSVPHKYGLTPQQSAVVADTLADSRRLSDSNLEEITPILGMKNTWCVVASGWRQTQKPVLINLIATAS